MMMAVRTKFEDFEVWQLARELCKRIAYIKASKNSPTFYSLFDQISRSSGSAMDNIAEGYGRGNNKEFIQFLGFSRGSVMECKSQLYRLCDEKIISEEQFLELAEMADSIGRQISGLIKYLKSTELKGLKYKTTEEPFMEYPAE